MKTRSIRWLLALLVGCCIATGCERESDNEKLDKLFTGDGAQIREAWTQARQYDAVDDYLRAAEAYDAVMQLSLTKKQMDGARRAVGQLYVRLTKAAAKGDPNAQNILEGLKKNLKD